MKRLKDYVEEYNKLGIEYDDYGDLYIIKRYILNENRFIDFSKIYTEMLVEENAKKDYIMSTTKEILGVVHQGIYNKNYTPEENMFITELIIDYACYGCIKMYNNDQLKEKISKMELPNTIPIDLMKYLIDECGVQFKEPYEPNKKYFYERFRVYKDDEIRRKEEKRSEI